MHTPYAACTCSDFGHGGLIFVVWRLCPGRSTVGWRLPAGDRRRRCRCFWKAGRSLRAADRARHVCWRGRSPAVLLLERLRQLQRTESWQLAAGGSSGLVQGSTRWTPHRGTRLDGAGAAASAFFWSGRLDQQQDRDPSVVSSAGWQLLQPSWPSMPLWHLALSLRGAALVSTDGYQYARPTGGSASARRTALSLGKGPRAMPGRGGSSSSRSASVVAPPPWQWCGLLSRVCCSALLTRLSWRPLSPAHSCLTHVPPALPCVDVSVRACRAESSCRRQPCGLCRAACRIRIVPHVLAVAAPVSLSRPHSQCRLLARMSV